VILAVGFQRGKILSYSKRHVTILLMNLPGPALPNIDPASFRRACASFATGITITTTLAQDGSAPLPG